MTPFNVVLLLFVAAVLFAPQIAHISCKPRKHRCVSSLLVPSSSSSSSSRGPEPAESTSSPRPPIPKLPFDLFPKPSPARNATAFSTEKSPSKQSHSSAVVSKPAAPANSSSLHHLFEFPLRLVSSLLLTLISPPPAIRLRQPSSPCGGGGGSDTNDSPPVISSPLDDRSALIPADDPFLPDNTNDSPASCNPASPNNPATAGSRKTSPSSSPAAVPCCGSRPSVPPADNTPKNSSPITPCSNNPRPQQQSWPVAGGPPPGPCSPRPPGGGITAPLQYDLVYNLLCDLLSHEVRKSKLDVPPRFDVQPESTSNDYYVPPPPPPPAGNTLVDGVIPPPNHQPAVLPCLFTPSRKNGKTHQTTQPHRALKSTRHVQPPPTRYDDTPAVVVSPHSRSTTLYNPPDRGNFANSTSVRAPSSSDDGLSPQEVVILKILRSLNSTSNAPSLYIQ